MSIKHILAIETSCDETAIAILRQTESVFNLLANEVSSQVKLHANWGGVVPNLAAREHVKNITPLLNLALKNAKLQLSNIDLFAVTHGPGLIPALLVGVNFAKTLAYLHEKPLVGIHHIEGHIYANFVGKSQNLKVKSLKLKKDSLSIIENCELKIENSTSIQFPVLVLVVSGGHTQLVFMKNHLHYQIIGQTLDDAVGEAFDKVARILGIGYPGGPAVAQWATQVESEKLKVESNTRYKIQFPRPMLNKKNFDFSFSGLKTAVLYQTKKHPELIKNKQYIAEVCREFQQACVDVLIAKTLKAAEQYQPKTIMLAGGVSANQELREQLGKAVQESIPNTCYMIPDTDLTGDNAAMIAAAAAFRWSKMSATQKKAAQGGWQKIQANANLKLK